MLKLEKVLCENKREPVNVDSPFPAFSWVLSSDRRDVYQKACRIRVWNHPIPGREGVLLWDSGYLETSQDHGIHYGGKPLKSRSFYSFSVHVWDNQGEEADSGFLSFSTAIFTPEEWRAEMVEPDQYPLGLTEHPVAIAKRKWSEYVSHLMKGEPAEFFNEYEFFQSSPGYPYFPAVEMFRKFSVKASVVRATLYATARGVYAFYINGRKGSDTLLAPEYTSYDKMIKFQAYDVTDQIHPGDNGIGFVITPGWYRGRVANGVGCEYGTNAGLLMELEMVYEDGTRETVLSDPEFVYSESGPWVKADIYSGETFDARRCIPDFSLPDMDTTGWKKVHRADFDKSTLVLQTDAPVRAVGEIKPVSLIVNARGETILDMGQNFAGHLRITGIYGEAGTEIKLEHTEELLADGTFTYPFTGKSQEQIDRFILKGEGEETFEPEFTYHGFRYVKITGQGTDPWELSQFTGIVIATDNEKAGDFRCSDPCISKLQENIFHSQLSNMLSLPTDCPTREKAGWTGDVAIYGKTSLFNQSLLEFYKEWLKSILREQLENGAIQYTVPQIPNYINQLGGASTGWGDVILTLPWELYKTYGDEEVLRENYTAMKRWMNYLENLAHQTPPGSSEDESFIINTGFQFGEWLVPSVVNDQGFADGQKAAMLTGFPVATMLYARDADLFGQIAQVLGDQETVLYYRELGSRIRTAFAHTWLTPEGRLGVDLQGLYVLALQFDMVPEESRGKLLERLEELIRENQGCLDTGFMSVPFILDVLSENGRVDLAYSLLWQDQCPSWLYEVKQGATTMWESWSAIKPDGSRDVCSFNHYAFGCVGDWMYRNLLGIINSGTGFDRVRISPRFDCPLTWAEGYHDTVHGRIRVKWEKEGDETTLSVEIPVNTRAEVVMPEGTVEVGSGKYRWTWKDQERKERNGKNH